MNFLLGDIPISSTWDLAELFEKINQDLYTHDPVIKVCISYLPISPSINVKLMTEHSE